MELSTLEYARNVARMLCASYPNQAHDAKTFGKQLTLALTNRPKSHLKTLVDPRSGYVAKHPFLSIASVNEWLDKLGGTELTELRREREITKQIEERKWTPPTPEQREQSLEMWRKVRDAMHKRNRPAASSVLTKEERDALDRAIADPEFPSLKGAKQIGEIL